MSVDKLISELGVMGPEAQVSIARFVPQVTGTYAGAIGTTGTVPTLENNGFSAVERVGTGSYQLTLENKGVGISAVEVSCIENDTTHEHKARCESFDSAAGTILVSHKSCTWATQGTGPLPSDVVDQLQVVVVARKTY